MLHHFNIVRVATEFWKDCLRDIFGSLVEWLRDISQDFFPWNCCICMDLYYFVCICICIMESSWMITRYIARLGNIRHSFHMHLYLYYFIIVFVLFCICIILYLYYFVFVLWRAAEWLRDISPGRKTLPMLSPSIGKSHLYGEITRQRRKY